MGACAGGDVAVWVGSVAESLGVSWVVSKGSKKGFWAYICAKLLGTINLSSPTSALPVALTRFSPFSVSGMSETPVWRPLSDHSVSPWRIIKTRGSGIVSIRRPAVVAAGRGRS